MAITSTFLYLEINILAILILLIIFKNITIPNVHYKSLDQKLFKVLILSVIAVFIFDSGMWYFDGKTFKYAMELNYISTIMYLFLHPVIGLCWLLYGNYKLDNKSYKMKNIALFSIPLMLHTLLVFLSLKTQWIFYIDDMNIYHRGELLLFTPILTFIYFGIMFYIILKKKRKKMKDFSKELNLYFFLFPIPPLIGAIFQMMFYGVSLIWIGVLLSILIVFIHFQNKQSFTDSLTGLYNRCFFESYIRRSMKVNTKRKYIFALMIDFDNFKHINDTYGHLSGDHALKEVAHLLKPICNQNDYIVRFGGDEFLIIGYSDQLSDLNAKIKNIDLEIMRTNRLNTFPFTISLSIGKAITKQMNLKSLSQLINEADDNMYAIKNEKKRKLNKQNE